MREEIQDTKEIKMDPITQMCIRDSSTTKYMDGHGATLGGAIVDSGKFDWMAHADKYPGLCTPDDSYHGITLSLIHI